MTDTNIEYLICIKTCHKYIHRSIAQEQELSKKLSEYLTTDSPLKIDYMYFIGRPNPGQLTEIESSVPFVSTTIGHWVHLDVEDNYETLPDKVYNIFRYVNEHYKDIKGIFMTDDDIIIGVHELAQEIINQSNSENPPRYWGLSGEDSIIPLIRKSDGHYGKCYRTFLHKYKRNWLQVHSCPGGGYYLDRTCLPVLLSPESEKLFLSNDFLYEKTIYDDNLVGYVLLKFGEIAPKSVDVLEKKIAIWETGRNL